MYVLLPMKMGAWLIVMIISKNHNSLDCKTDIKQSPNAQDAFWPIPGPSAIYAGMIRSVGVLRHACYRSGVG